MLGWRDRDGLRNPEGRDLDILHTDRCCKEENSSRQGFLTDTPMAVRSTRALFVGKRWKKGYRGGASPHLPQ